MARPRKTVAPTDDGITISKEPIVFANEEVVEAAEPVMSQRSQQIEALRKLFPRAPIETYDDNLLNALYQQHIGTVPVTV